MSARSRAGLWVASGILLLVNVAASFIFLRDPGDSGRRLRLRLPGSAGGADVGGGAAVTPGGGQPGPDVAAPPLDQESIDEFYRARGFVRVSRSALPQVTVTSPIFFPSNGRVPRDIATFLDLNYAETSAIAAIYESFKPRVAELMDRAAVVDVREAGLAIRFEFGAGELAELNREIDRQIAAALDPSSAANYRYFDRRDLIDSFTPVPLEGLTIDIARTDAGMYTAVIKSSRDGRVSTGHRTGSGGMVLDDFYGSIVRRHYPRAAIDEADFAARKRAANRLLPQPSTPVPSSP